jgi:hypothetical protein
MAAGKSTPGSATEIPTRAAARTSRTARADRSSAFEGTQPTFRQSPPSLSRSMSATRAPSPAAPKAETSPAVPPPIAMRSYYCAASVEKSRGSKVASG